MINDRTSGGQNRLETERQRRYSFPPLDTILLVIFIGHVDRRTLSLSLSRDSNFRGFSLSRFRLLELLTGGREEDLEPRGSLPTRGRTPPSTNLKIKFDIFIEIHFNRTRRDNARKRALSR